MPSDRVAILFSMTATIGWQGEERLQRQREQSWREEQRRVDELTTLSAHLNAGTARWLELVWEACQTSDDPARFIAYRCGITLREAREVLRVAQALQELPATRAAFARGELTYTKVRALTRVATAACEEGLVELAGALTASQLERALRAFRRVVLDDVRHVHELEYVEYFYADDGSLVLRARLAAEDGALLVLALDSARERIVERRREERAAVGNTRPQTPDEDGPPRSLGVEALLELGTRALEAAPGADTEVAQPRTRIVVHVDAAALTSDGPGRSELEQGPLIPPETARRLGCDAEIAAQVERDGLPLSVGRARRTVPPALRRLLETRDDTTCCFPGCERRRHLQAHHRRHWAHGGETSLANLVLLCHQHHRLAHEGGYTVESDDDGLRFRNRFGLVCSTIPPRPPPASSDDLLADNRRLGLEIDADTNRHGRGQPLDLPRAVSAIKSIVGVPYASAGDATTTGSRVSASHGRAAAADHEKTDHNRVK